MFCIDRVAGLVYHPPSAAGRIATGAYDYFLQRSCRLVRVVLLQPPVKDFYATPGRCEPLGLEYLATALTAAGHEAFIVDSLESNRAISEPLPAVLKHMMPHYPQGDMSPFRLFSAYQHFGLPISEAGERVEALVPDLIGIAANFTPYISETLACAAEVKRRLPHTPVVLGGHHATVWTESLMRRSEVDFVIRGEGEQALPELASTLETGGALSQVGSLSYRDAAGCVLHNPVRAFVSDLGTLAWPRRTPGRTMQMMLSSRGCPRRCGFCSIGKVMGTSLRTRNVEDVVDEIEEAVRAGARSIDFEDDNMNWARDRMLRLVKELSKRFAGRGVRFSAMNGLVAERLDREILGCMREAGFEDLNLAVVTGRARLQERIGRSQPTEDFERAVEAARAHGLSVTAYLILGLPEDDVDGMLDDVLWLSRLPARLGPSVFYPAPGTSLHDLCVEKGWIQEDATTELRSSAYPVETDRFTRTDLVTLMRLCRFINFAKQFPPQELLAEIEKPDETIMASKPPEGRSIISPSRLTRRDAGVYLARRLLLDGELRGLACRRRRSAPYLYEEIEFRSSETIVRKGARHLLANPPEPVAKWITL